MEVTGPGIVVRVPATLFSRDVLRRTCLVLSRDFETEILADEPGGEYLHVRLIPFDSAVVPALAERMLWGELLGCSMNTQLRAQEAELRELFAGSANRVGTAHFNWVREHVGQEEIATPSSPNVSPGLFDLSEKVQELAACGYVAEFDREKGEVHVTLSSARFLLPVLLSAARSIQPDVQTTVRPLTGARHYAVLHPKSEQVTLEEALDLFVQTISAWELPLLPKKTLLEANLDDPVDAAFLAASRRPGHPAAMGADLPITYYRTTYGQLEGISLPYRLGEVLTQEVAPGQFLVSTRHRAWAVLNSAQYRLLMEMRVHEDAALFSLCESLGLILTRRNFMAIAKIHERSHRFMQVPPGLFLLIVTNRCNLGCTYCHAEAGEAGDHSLDMDEATAYKAVEYFLSVPMVKERGRIEIEFQGGECLLKWDLILKVMDYTDARAAELGLKTHYVLCTNLVGMTDEIAAEIARRGAGISTSLDGPCEIHDRQRPNQGGGGSYERVTYWSRRLRETYGIQHGYLPTLTRNHIGKERELVDEFRRQGCPVVYLRYMNEVGRGHAEGGRRLGLTPEEYVALWKRGAEHILACDQRGERIVERKTMALLGNMLSPTWSYMCLRRPCGTGMHQVVIDQRGDVYSCDQGRSNPIFCLGNIQVDSYDDCYTSATARTLRTLTSELMPDCAACALGVYCGYCVCRGVLQHETPQPNMNTDFECRVYRRLIPELVRTLMQPERAAVLTRWIE